MDPVRFETHPSEYKHWKLEIAPDGQRELARLVMDVDDAHALREGYELKLNSYDLSVDIELADAIQRIRFEHPEVRTVVVTADLDRVFCSGANIYMLGASTHSFKVNFCKYTNETRLYIEDASAHSGLRFLAACKGTTAGGGYELALACDEIVLVDDGASAVSFPETPLLAVLPGTGGLTRLVDKRKVRRDRADVFCTLAEGIKGRRALEWGLIDGLVSRSKFDDGVYERSRALAAQVAEVPRGPAVELTPLRPEYHDSGVRYRHVDLAIDRDQRVATLTVSAPTEAPPTSRDDMVAQGADLWSLRAFRELDDALCHLRFNEPELGLVLLRTSGDPAHVLAADQALADHAECGFVREVRLLQARVLRRLDNTARSLFAVIDQDSNCFAGSLLEVALAADRVYMLEDDDEQVGVYTSVANTGVLPTGNGLGRLAVRFYGAPDQVGKLLERGHEGMIPTAEAAELGLATIAADDIDFEDELRIACEERASLSPDALTGMEASLRYPGPETLETKIFGRLSAWQNWIFTRKNATGEQGALTLYGRPERPSFHWTRT
ncbi:2,3-epoxybenzoyl-CoA dihydrolase [Haliangium sp.]|uniref:2,3-epoxybenzoyl-CoA dihydrolase n=1 Tax=Haliangium sp. TaxID=2663208 RepID=UPI003D15052F